MEKYVLKMKYRWHFFRFQYHKTLLNDCLCNDLRLKLQGKAEYHERKAVSLFVKI